MIRVDGLRSHTLEWVENGIVRIAKRLYTLLRGHFLARDRPPGVPSQHRRCCKTAAPPSLAFTLVFNLSDVAIGFDDETIFCHQLPTSSEANTTKYVS